MSHHTKSLETVNSKPFSAGEFVKKCLLDYELSGEKRRGLKLPAVQSGQCGLLFLGSEYSRSFDYPLPSSVLYNGRKLRLPELLFDSLFVQTSNTTQVVLLSRLSCQENFASPFVYLVTA